MNLSMKTGLFMDRMTGITEDSVIPVILLFFKNTVTYLAAELSRWYEKGDGQSVVIPKEVA